MSLHAAQLQRECHLSRVSACYKLQEFNRYQTDEVNTREYGRQLVRALHLHQDNRPQHGTPLAVTEWLAKQNQLRSEIARVQKAVLKQSEDTNRTAKEITTVCAQQCKQAKERFKKSSKISLVDGCTFEQQPGVSFLATVLQRSYNYFEGFHHIVMMQGVCHTFRREVQAGFWTLFDDTLKRLTSVEIRQRQQNVASYQQDTTRWWLPNLTPLHRPLGLRRVMEEGHIVTSMRFNQLALTEEMLQSELSDLQQAARQEFIHFMGRPFWELVVSNTEVREWAMESCKPKKLLLYKREAARFTTRRKKRKRISPESLWVCPYVSPQTMALPEFEDVFPINRITAGFPVIPIGMVGAQLSSNRLEERQLWHLVNEDKVDMKKLMREVQQHGWRVVMPEGGQTDNADVSNALTSPSTESSEGIVEL